ncbi:MAG: PEP-CTERM sorting domain-containing protein [Aquabacterium sp.]|nr:MAG: PEP-CTERM sorting domain-containing protein [Aquabacterium sp.]
MQFLQSPISRIVALFAACSTSIAAHAAPVYQAALLESLPGPYSAHAYAISNAGVVGYFESYITGGSLPAYWSLDGAGKILPVLSTPSVYSPIHYAYNINNEGMITGRSTTQLRNVHAYVTTPDGVIHDLGALPVTTRGSDSNGQSVNVRGAVVGESETDAGLRAFMWTADGGMRSLGTLPGGSWSSASDINDAGAVVGSSATANGRGAFLWTEQEGMLDLGELAGGLHSSTAEGINAAGQVVGNSLTAAGWAPFIWTKASGMKGLGTLGGTNGSFAQGINASGQVVGGSSLPGWGQTGAAFLWSELEGMLNLNDLLLDADPLKLSGLRLTYASDINDNGQILVTGLLNDRLVQAILTPVPEPSTLALALVGVLFLWARRTRGGGHITA